MSRVDRDLYYIYNDIVYYYSISDATDEEEGHDWGYYHFNVADDESKSNDITLVIVLVFNVLSTSHNIIHLIDNNGIIFCRHTYHPAHWAYKSHLIYKRLL